MNVYEASDVLSEFSKAKWTVYTFSTHVCTRFVTLNVLIKLLYPFHFNVSVVLHFHLDFHDTKFMQS